MPPSHENKFKVGDWLVEPESDRISKGSESTYLRPQVMELLVYLARHSGRVASASDLHEDLWAGKIVTSGTVYNCVAELRRVLSDGEEQQAYIETIPKKGYRLLATVTGFADRPATAINEPAAGGKLFAAITNKSKIVVVSVVAIIGAALAATFFSGLLTPGNRPTESQPDRLVQRFKIDNPEKIRLNEVGRNPVAITSDGQHVIFFGIDDGQSQLYSRSLDSLEVRPIEGTQRSSVFAAGFDISPDDRWIAFQGEGGQLQKVPVGGGIPVTLSDLVGNVRDISWGPDGQIVFTTNADPGLMQISETGGTPRQLTAPDDGDFHKHVSYLPDGGALVFVIGQRGSNPNPDNRIAVLSLKSGDQKTLLHGETPHATSNGQLIYFKDHSLWAVNLDRDRLDISGESMPIVHGVHYTYYAHFSVSTRGTLVYVLPTKLIERQLVWVDRTGNEETIALDRRPYSMPRVSPDGDRIAVVVESDAGPDLWVYSISRSDGIRLTFEESRESMPVWSPESKYLYFNARATNDIFRVSADGSGATEPILVGAPNYWPVDFSPDGNLLLFEEYDARANSMGVRTIDLSEQPKIADLITAPFEEGEAVVAPDGKWLAYASNRTGQFEVYIRPYPNIEAPLIAVSVGGGSLPSWGVDGRELFYKGRDHMMGVKVYIGPTLTVGKPEHLFSTDAYVHETTGNFDYDPTRDRFLMVKRPSEYDMSRDRIVIVQNWLEEVSRTLASN